MAKLMRKFAGLLLKDVSDRDLEIFARDLNAELSRRFEAKQAEAYAQRAALVTRHYYRCHNGHEFTEDVAGGACPWHSYARSADVRPDKPKGGVCDFCNGSIYQYKSEPLGHPEAAAPFCEVCKDTHPPNEPHVGALLLTPSSGLWDRVAHRYGIDQRDIDWIRLRAAPVVTQEGE
jgi:hypothetical protein